MSEITYLQLFLLITIIWIITRLVVAVKTKTFSIFGKLKEHLYKKALEKLINIFRFVYFGFHLENGKIPTLKIGFGDDIHDMISIIPFYFLVDRYDGWKMNVIGNIAMFIPVGIVWPICFKQLDTIRKTIFAGAGFTLFIELTQLVCIGRHTDIDDLILNTIGVAIGACIVFLIRINKEKHC